MFRKPWKAQYEPLRQFTPIQADQGQAIINKTGKRGWNHSERRIWRALSVVFPFHRFAVVYFYLCWSYICLQGSNVKVETPLLVFSVSGENKQKSFHFEILFKYHTEANVSFALHSTAYYVVPTLPHFGCKVTIYLRTDVIKINKPL